MKQHLTNTKKHFDYGTRAGAYVMVALWLLGALFSDYRGELSVFACIGWFMLTVNYERNQFVLSKMTLRGYLRKKWLDCIVDVLAGNIPFLIIMKAGGQI